MVKIILDSNFLFIPLQFKIDIFEELKDLFGKPDFIILSTTKEELEKLMKNNSEKIRKQTSTALELTKKCRIVNVERQPEESYDDVIIRYTKKWEGFVGTNDIKLRKKLREKGTAVVFMRKKAYLEIDGSP